ncbi:MAG: protein TolR [Rhodospirillales bacterium]
MAGVLQGRRRTATGRFQRAPTRPIAEINVTPFVDVMLVLLVIFMITAPLLATGVQVDLPKAPASQLPDQNDALSVTVDNQGRIFLQDNEVALDGLGAKLKAITNNNQDIRIFVRGDGGIAYGQVMTVLGAVYDAGYRKVALLTEPMGSGKTAGRPRTAEAGTRP